MGGFGLPEKEKTDTLILQWNQFRAGHDQALETMDGLTPMRFDSSWFRSNMPAPLNKPEVVRDVASRWTPVLAKLGWTPISIYFLDNYHRLAPPVRYSEAMFIIHLMRHKWDSSAPYPSFGTLGKRMGVSTEAARSYARSLQKKGYLMREGQTGETNRFHLTRLFAALERLIVADAADKQQTTQSIEGTPAA